MITTDKLKRFLKGELTWAEVEGITADKAMSYLKVGVELFEQGNYAQATRVFEGLIAINPKNPHPYAFLAATRFIEGDDAAARRAYDAALALDPKHLLALTGRGELRLKHQDTLGVQDLQRAAELDPMGLTTPGRRAAGLVRALRTPARLPTQLPAVKVAARR
jgi:tetratricopeptide (TPR) repeat protein